MGRQTLLAKKEHESQRGGRKKTQWRETRKKPQGQASQVGSVRENGPVGGVESEKGHWEKAGRRGNSS